LGYQFKDLDLAARDAEILSFSLVRDERFPGRDKDFLHSDPLPRSSQPNAEPDTKNGKGRRSQPTVDFDRMLNYQETILSPLQQRNQDATD
jgi:hypothetical protein